MNTRTMRGMRRARLLAPVVGLTMLAGTLVACGSDTETGPNPSAPADFQAAAVINERPISDLKEGGNLNYPITDYPPNFNYHQVDGTTVNLSRIMSGLYLSPFSAAADGSLTPNLDLITSAESVVTDGKQTVTYKLNPDAKWSTGRAIDLSDFEAEWKALNGTNAEYQNSSTTGYEDIESITQGVDDKEIVVNLNKVYGDWRGLFSPLYPHEANESPEAFNTGFLTKFPPTSGPFKEKSYDPGAKRLVLQRDDGWWGDRAVLDTITYIGLDATAQIGALQNGEIDIMDLGSLVDAFKAIQSMPNIELRQSQGMQFRHWDFNGAEGRVTADPEVRQALMKGIDRDLIAKALLGPITSNPTVLSNHFILNGQTGYQDNGGVTFDPAAAKKILEDDGWALDGEFYKKDGKQLDVEVTIPADTANASQEASLMQQSLRQIGVNLKVVNAPADSFIPDYVIPGNFDTTIYTWEGTPYLSSACSIYTSDGGQNIGTISSPRIDELCTQLKGEIDPVKQAALANEADAEVWKVGHSLTTYQRPFSYATNKQLANIGAPGFGDTDMEKVGWLK